MNISVDDVRLACPLFQAECGGSTPTSALQLIIREVNMRTAQDLNRLWHSVLPETHLGNLLGKPKSIAYTAQHEDVFYAVAIWTTPISANRLAGGWNMLELRRLAISDDAPRNSASRMLSIMTMKIKKKWPEVTKLISYQAKDHHRGTIYKAAGWIAVAEESRPMLWHIGKQFAPLQTLSNKIRWELDLAG